MRVGSGGGVSRRPARCRLSFGWVGNCGRGASGAPRPFVLGRLAAFPVLGCDEAGVNWFTLVRPTGTGQYLLRAARGAASG